MSSRFIASALLAAAALLPAACPAAEVEFDAPPPRKMDAPSAKGVTICISADAVKDLRQFEERPATPDIPSLQSARVPKDRCVARNRSLYGKGLDNILIAGNKTVGDLVADTLANALSGMGFEVVRDPDEAPPDAVHAEILIDRFWGWMDVPQGRVFLDETYSDMVGGMETRINLARKGGSPVTVTATGDGRARQGLRYGAAWQKMMVNMLTSYMTRTQARFAELDFASLGKSAAPAASSGAAAPAAPGDEKAQLRKLKQMREEGLITDEEYQEKRKDILDRM